jgi:hypothetical protein
MHLSRACASPSYPSRDYIVEANLRKRADAWLLLFLDTEGVVLQSYYINSAILHGKARKSDGKEPGGFCMAMANNAVSTCQPKQTK